MDPALVVPLRKLFGCVGGFSQSAIQVETIINAHSLNLKKFSMPPATFEAGLLGHKQLQVHIYDMF